LIKTEYDILNTKTHFRYFARMRAPPMPCPTAALAERLVAHITRVRFVAGVRASVCRQMATFGERLVARITCVRSFAGVRVPMSCLTTAVGKWLVAQIARVRSIAGVPPPVLRQTCCFDRTTCHTHRTRKAFRQCASVDVSLNCRFDWTTYHRYCKGTGFRRGACAGVLLRCCIYWTIFRIRRTNNDYNSPFFRWSAKTLLLLVNKVCLRRNCFSYNYLVYMLFYYDRLEFIDVIRRGLWASTCFIYIKKKNSMLVVNQNLVVYNQNEKLRLCYGYQNWWAKPSF